MDTFVEQKEHFLALCTLEEIHKNLKGREVDYIFISDDKGNGRAGFSYSGDLMSLLVLVRMLETRIIAHGREANNGM